jgi:hypothetical protein
MKINMKRKKEKKSNKMISQISLVVNVVFFLLDDFPASEFYVSMLRNALSVPSSYVVYSPERKNTTTYDELRGRKQVSRKIKEAAKIKAVCRFIYIYRYASR